MYINTCGLVLREAEYKESSKMLTVLTPDLGKISVSAKGAKRRGSKIAAASQYMVFSEMTLFRSGEMYTLTEARTVELFYGLRDDVEKLALGAYFTELLDTLTDDYNSDPAVLSLGLNSLYALSAGKKADRLIKAAFELRLMCLSGFAPLLDSCASCGTDELQTPYFDIKGGTVVCGNCKRGKKIDGSTLDAMRYISSCDPKKLFSFTIDDDSLRLLSDISEEFAETQLDRHFYTLNYYKQIRSMK